MRLWLSQNVHIVVHDDGHVFAYSHARSKKRSAASIPYPSALNDCMSVFVPCASPRPFTVPSGLDSIQPKEPYPFAMPPSDTMVMLLSLVMLELTTVCLSCSASWNRFCSHGSSVEMNVEKDVTAGARCGRVVVMVWRVGMFCFVVGTAAAGSASRWIGLLKLKRSARGVSLSSLW